MTQWHKELHQHSGRSITQLLHQSAATRNSVCKTTALLPYFLISCASRVEGRRVQMWVPTLTSPSLSQSFSLLQAMGWAESSWAWSLMFLAWHLCLVFLMYRPVPSSSLCCVFLSLCWTLLPLSPAVIPLCVSILQSNPGSNPTENKYSSSRLIFLLAPSSPVPAWHRALHTGERGESLGQRFVLADYTANMTWSIQTNLVYTAITIFQS